MAVGRNEPCPCGSGRKYKHCCLLKASESPEEQRLALWRRLRTALERYPSRMLGFIFERYGRGAVAEAWIEFVAAGEDVSAFDPDIEEERNTVFMSWLFHAWRPDPALTKVADAALHGVVPTRAYLARYGHRLDREEARYLDACMHERFGFFEVVDHSRGEGLKLRSLWGGEPKRVLERAAAGMLERGDLVYGLIVPVQDFWMLECIATRTFDVQQHIKLIDEIAALTARRDGESETDPAVIAQREDRALRALYLQFHDEIVGALGAEDGEDDALQLQTLYFRVTSAAVAFDRLHTMDVTRTREELLETATIDDDGTVKRAEIIWAQAGNPVFADVAATFIGRIRIDGETLSLALNSDARAEEGQGLIESALGTDVEYLHTEEGITDDWVDDGEPARTADECDDDEPDDDELDDESDGEEDVEEELRYAATAERLAAFFTSWPDEPLPLLGGLTPLQAMADPVGRAKVAALVNNHERNARDGLGVPAAVFSTLRARLGL